MERGKKLEIVPIDHDDLITVRNLRVRENQQRFVCSPPGVLELIKELGLEETSLPYVITVGEEPVGFFTLNFYSLAVDYYLENDRQCSIQSFMIDKAHQRKGYARKAMDRIFTLINRMRGKINLIKLTVNRHNNAAKALYLKCGFTDTGRIYLDGPSGPQHIYSRTI